MKRLDQNNDQSNNKSEFGNMPLATGVGSPYMLAHSAVAISCGTPLSFKFLGLDAEAKMAAVVFLQMKSLEKIESEDFDAAIGTGIPLAEMFFSRH